MKSIGDINNMSNIYRTCKISPTPDNKYILLESYIMVPKGYKTNGANIPMIFWWVASPFKPAYLPAIIIHDYLCDEERYEEADAYFEKILYTIDYRWNTWLMVKFVKMYHKIKYDI